MSILKEYNEATDSWVPIMGGGGGSTEVEALSFEEMLELFADTDLTKFAGTEYVEYTADPNGDYVYDETIQDYRPYRSGDTGTRYSADSGYAGYEEDNVFYILIF